MNEFRTLLIEGVFYEKDGRTVAVKEMGDAQEICVEDALLPLVGDEIQFAVHHLPPNPPDPSKWGGGCCLWEPNGICPAGHNEHPERILNISVRGVLRTGDGKWWIETFEGKRQEIPFRYLDGHRARVAAATVFNVEKMREMIGRAGVQQIETLGVQAAEIKDLLAKFQDLVKDGKG